MKIENENKTKAQELKEKYKDFMAAQDDFYSAYKAEFGESRELELLIYQGIQIDYKQKEYFKSLTELIDNTDFESKEKN